jgi:hypothetical protein
VMEAAGYVAPAKPQKGPQTLAGNTLFSQALSASEEVQLLDYLSFIRSKKS